MKKKITVLLFALGSVFTANAQYNLFDPADVDADGWLWFDTQAKIDKYIGMANNEDGKLDPNGKLIQLVSADFGDYEDSTVDPEVKGPGTDKLLGGTDAKTGAIITAKASASMSTNGGGILVRMPSCTTFSLSLASEVNVMVRLLGSRDENIAMKDYKIASALYGSTLKPLFRGGQFTWSGMELLNNGDTPVFTLKSDQPTVAYLQSLTKGNIYIHGIKVLTSTQPTGFVQTGTDSGISFDGVNLSVKENANIQIYSTTGVLVASQYTRQMSLSGLEKGIYIVKANTKTIKISIR